MAQVSNNCRICKKVTQQKIVTITDNLPPHVQVLECLGCGVMGVELVGDLDASE
jgi:MinD superfamily P-loop ATPase